MNDNQCSSTAMVVPGCRKRCIRYAGHHESHIWVESESRIDGLPILVQWDPNGVRRFEYQPFSNSN